MHSFIMYQCFFVVSKYYLSYNVTVKLGLNLKIYESIKYKNTVDRHNIHGEGHMSK